VEQYYFVVETKTLESLKKLSVLNYSYG